MAYDPDLPQLKYGDDYILPDRNSYQFENPNGARRTNIPGGPMRIDTDHMGGPFRVTVSYFADTPLRVKFFQLFWLRATFEGSIPFQCGLALESGEIFTDYIVRLLEAPKWNGFTGYTGRVSCSFEVEQRVVDYEYEDTLYWLYEAYGDDAPLVLEELENLTNPVMDQWIPA